MLFGMIFIMIVINFFFYVAYRSKGEIHKGKEWLWCVTKQDCDFRLIIYVQRHNDILSNVNNVNSKKVI